MAVKTCATCAKDLKDGHLWCYVCTRFFCGACRDADRREHESFGNRKYWGLRD